MHINVHNVIVSINPAFLFAPKKDASLALLLSLQKKRRAKVSKRKDESKIDDKTL